MSQNAKIAAALGKQLWSTDLYIPHYRSGEIGEWRINPGGQLINDWGYYTGNNLVEMLPSLARRVRSGKDADCEHWEVWMSLTPHEIESQEIGCLHASGEVVIMGLGMGWIAANAALNPNVTAVTVVELDPHVIDLFGRSGAFESLPHSAQRKLTIVNADAMEWRTPAPGIVDFLYVDIWLHLAEPLALEQVRQMQANIHANRIYYWGQEIAIYCAVKELRTTDSTLSSKVLEQVLIEKIMLPLLIPNDRDYPVMIEQVIQNRLQRRLEVKVEIEQPRRVKDGDTKTEQNNR